jgi:3'-phosphoadenosine 5'-phosphosulfate sulfotransferase (PAPS reductase)/FAD synthetase
MSNPIEAIKAVSQKTNKILLFHSGAGKDSIALLDMLAPHFEQVVCVYMYVVKNLSHIDNYIEWAKAKYPNCRFLVYPHYSLSGYIKSGFMGIAKDEKQKLYTMADITERARFKQSDSLNRRLMLRTYDKSMINWDTGKLYPLSEWKNGDVLKYIEAKGLAKPLTYGGKHQSHGTAVNDINFLLWLKEKAPADLLEVYNQFPESEIMVHRHEHQLNF